MKKIAVYAGRFQPFGPHHKRAFDWMCERFGVENCYISTSNRMDENSPLSFAEKCSVMSKYGINTDRIIQSSSPYRIVSDKINPMDSILFLMIGAKDESNISYFKPDGTNRYYKEYYGQRNLEDMSKSGYVIFAPHYSIKHNNNEISGTYLRKTIPTLNEDEFTSMMGWYDRPLHEMFIERFGGLDQIGSINQSGTKHIQHIYEDKGLSTQDISEIFAGILTGKIKCYEKFDGVNLQVTYKYGDVMASRNKGTTVNPMTLQELNQMYEGRGIVKDVFVEGFTAIRESLLNLPKNVLVSIGSNNIFLNLEIIDPRNPNIYEYGQPTIVLHNLIRYDQSGNEIGRKIETKLAEQLQHDVYRIIGPNPITIPKMGAFAGSIRQLLGTISDPIQLENAITKVGYNILKNSTGHLAIGSKVQDRFAEVSKKILEEDDDRIKDKYFSNLERVYPSIDKSLPFEGIVFEWRGNTYKLTGSYRYINQILGLYRYSR